MLVVKKELPNRLKTLEILPISDWHIGDIFCDKKSIENQINYIKNNENVYCVLNGDLANNATKTSISDCYAEQLTPMKQIEKILSYLTPIKDKILAVTSGNHEKRTYKKEGIDLTEIFTRELGINDIYSKSGICLFLSLGEDKRHKHKDGTNGQINYTIYMNHGSGGGRKEGSKAIRLADMASIIDADIYIHSHTHLPMIMKENYYRTDTQNKSIIEVTKLFVNTASSVKYGGYGEEYEYKPGSTHNPIIYLSGNKKLANAKL